MFNKVISILGTLILLVLAGCRDVAPISVEEPSTENRTITLNLDITSKASASPDESPTDFNLWIFNGDKLLGYISDDPVWNEIYNGGIDLRASVEAEIDSKGVTKIQFYLLLNTNVEKPKTLTPAELKELVFTIPKTPYTHDNKVPMSGEATLDIYPSQFHYAVRIDATRSVAKLGIYCTKGNPSSTLTINQVTLSKVPDKGYLFKPDPDSYTSIKYTGTKNLLSITEQITVTKYYKGKMPSYSGDSWAETTTEEESFEEISSPYLLENLNGEVDYTEGFLQLNGQVSPEDKRYCITLSYTLNEADYTQKIYVSQIERNQYSKIYIRINDAITVEDIYCQVNSWTEHEIDVPAFE